MEWITVMPYYKVEREMTGFEQRTIIQDRLMYLYKEKIVTKYREFPIIEVFDLSYRSMGGDEGLLYLHTRQGVFSYTVSTDPNAFIQAYKNLVRM